MTHWYRHPPSRRPAVKEEIDQKGRRLPVVTYEVKHERVNYVSIDCISGHAAIVLVTIVLIKTVARPGGIPEFDGMITHIKFVSVPTTDQDRAVEFWTRRVGFRVFTDQPFSKEQRWIELRVGNSETRFVLFNSDNNLKPGMAFNGALACANVEETYRELAERGVEFVGPPEKQPWGTFAIFKDPDGNQFVLSSR